jgi:sugar phosphate isomerase/epimerase
MGQAKVMANSDNTLSRWGVDTWVLEAFPIENAVHILEEEGFHCFEYAYEHFKQDDLRGTVSSKIKNLSDEVSTLSIEASQMHAPYGELDSQLASPDEATRSSGIRKAREWLQYASMLGVKVLVFHPACHKSGTASPSGDDWQQSKAWNREVFAEIGRFGREVGVRVALENRDDPVFGSRLEDLLEIVQIDPDSLGVCLDTGHANINGFACGRFAIELGEHLIATHIHDNDGRSDQHLLPFVGNIDWDEFLDAIERCHYGGRMIVEVPGSDTDQHLCLEKIKLVKRLMDII